MKQIKMRLSKDAFLKKSNVQIRNLLEVVNELNSGAIQKPLHQRDRVWSEEQKQGWVSRLDSSIQPVGVIVLYQIRKNPEVTWLNDGYQRLTATAEFLVNPEKFGCAPEDAKFIVSACEMPVQNRVYESHDDALQDFQFLNIGTKLTPYEFYLGIIAYLDSYRIGWRDFFNKLHNVVMPIGSQVLAGSSINRVEQNNNRELRHKTWRDDYALFHRYFTKQKAPIDYNDVGQKNPTLEQLKNQSVIEWKLRNTLEKTDLDSAQKELGNFKNKIARETALIREIIPDALGDPNARITLATYRWLLHVSIWRSFNGISQGKWEDFTLKILSAGGGGATIIDPGNPRRKSTLQMGRVGAKLKGICDIIGSDMYLGKPQRDEPILKSGKGYDHSHVLPFVSNGNGETYIEPAGRNRSRGAQEVVNCLDEYDEDIDNEEDEEDEEDEI